MPTPAAVMGNNVRRLRGAHTADELAREAQAWGLKGGTARIAELEGGRVSPTLPTIYLLTLALADLLDRPVAPTELFEGAGKVAMPGGEIELRMLRSTLSSEPPRRPKLLTTELDAWIADMQDTWPDRLMDLPAGKIRKTSAAMREADVRIGKSLGLDAYRAAAEMAYLWGKPLSAVRDERSGPDANAQKRGRVARELKAQLQEVISGDD
ncbi:MAG: hypothetical protein QOC62_5887 [Mycobacterium sp.]|jgi:hypothetical protein|nr:hypothetical protein [Mycobacterium sp.]